MLSTTAPSSSPHQYSFSPVFPSPLSPRSANIYGARRHQQQSYYHFQRVEPMATADENSEPTTKFEDTSGLFTFSAPPPPRRELSGQGVPFAQRRIKVAPPVARAGDLKERRRGQFLKKVEQGRDGSRWEKRGDDILRMDFMQRQRQWEEAQARSAASLALDDAALGEEDEDEMDEAEDQIPDALDLPTFSSSGFGSQMQMSSQRPTVSYLPQLDTSRNEEDEIDRLLRNEDEELEMLLSYMQTEGGNEGGEGQGQQGKGGNADSLWSDDADYDALFSELLLSQEAQVQQVQQQPLDGGGSMEMDMS